LKRLIISIALLLIFSFPAFSQIEIIIDDNDAGFSMAGTWNTSTDVTCYNESAKYKRRVTDSTTTNYCKWSTRVVFPGQYIIETYNINNKFAPDARFTIHTQDKDTTLLVNQYYNPGWDSLGIFLLSEDFWVKVPDYFKKDSLTKNVYADAIRLRSIASTHTMSGSFNLSAGDTFVTGKIELLQAGTGHVFLTEIMNPGNQSFAFENVVDGWYKIRCTAWSYDSLVVDSIQLAGQDLSSLSYSLNPTAGSRFVLSGSLSLDDSSATNKIFVAVYPIGYSYKANWDSVGHDGTYSFPNLPSGHYKLIFTGKGYLPDTTTYQSVNLTQDVNLSTLTLYSFFQFAWISDSHVGAGSSYDLALQTVITNINAISDEVDFLYHTGDMTEKGMETELTTAAGILNKSKIPYYCVAGNHESKWSDNGLRTMEKLFRGSHWSFNHKGYHIVGINNAVQLRGGGGNFDPADLNWLKNDLASMADSTTPVIIGFHLPSEFSGVFDYWKALDILKEYRTILIIVGHGHTNTKFDFEGLPGAESLDTYNSSGCGFNVVNVSRKGITVTTHYSQTTLADKMWCTKPFTTEIQPEIEFSNLTEGESVTGTKSIQIQVEKAMTSGTYSIRYGDVTGSLAGSNQDWTFNLNTASLENGYHTITATFKDIDGKEFCRTRGFCIENGYPKADWRVNLGATIITAPAYDNDNVYVGTSDGRIVAMKFSDGSDVWTVQTDGGIWSSPCVYDSVVYVGSAEGNLYAINGRTGTVLWTFNAGNAIMTPPVVVDSIVYFAGSGKFFAVNRLTERKIWEYVSGGMIECKPAISGDYIIFGSWDRYVHKLNRFTGALAWKWNKQTSFYYAPGSCWPVVTSDKVFVTDPMKNLTAINLETGATIWESGGTPQSWESIGISEDKSRVYVRCLDGYLYAFSTTTTTKQQLWSAATDFGWDSTPSMPMERYNAVMTGCKKGSVSSVMGTTGQILWKYWGAQTYITTVTPIDGVKVLAASIDGWVTLIHGDPTTKIEKTPNTLPMENRLLPSYPNPFNSSTTICYSLKHRQDVRITIYNVLGEEIFSRTFRNMEAGNYEIPWIAKNHTGRELPSGVYIIKITGDKFSETQKTLLIR